MWKKLLALFKPKPLPADYTLYSCSIPVWGDWYEYKVPAASKEEAILKLILYFESSGKSDIVSKNKTVHYPGRDVVETNLPISVHLGISGERMTPAQYKDYTEWKDKAEEYKKKIASLNEAIG